MAVAPGALDQNAPRSWVAGQREAAALDAFAGRALRGNQAEESYQQPRIVEVPDVTDLDGDGNRDDQGDAAQRLIGRHGQLRRPIRDEVLDVTLEPRKAFGGSAPAS